MLIIASDAYVVDNTVFRYTVYFCHFVFVCFYCTIVLHKLIMLLPTCPDKMQVLETAFLHLSI